MEIRLDEEACRAHNISINTVRSALSSNSSDRVFAGRVFEGDRRLFVNVSAEYTDVSEIGNIILSRDGPILLKDVAEIFFGVKDETSYSRVNGLDAVTISLVYDNQANLIDLSHKHSRLLMSSTGLLCRQELRLLSRTTMPRLWRRISTR
ncbi:MAG: efflux RND transporter permease subunit [Bacteroidales bacterium]